MVFVDKLSTRNLQAYSTFRHNASLCSAEASPKLKRNPNENRQNEFLMRKNFLYVWIARSFVILLIPEEITGYASKCIHLPPFSLNQFGFKNGVLQKFSNLSCNKNIFVYFCVADMRKLLLKIFEPVSMFIHCFYVKFCQPQFYLYYR
jgi:hypothetical protein